MTSGADNGILSVVSGDWMRDCYEAVTNATLGDAVRLISMAFRAAAAGVAILLMEVLAGMAGEPMFRVPFVTSIVLVTALPETPPARPAAIVGGHLISSFAGWLVGFLPGSSEALGAAAVALATLGMLVARSVHPPAGVDGFLVATSGLSVTWILSPVLVGALLLAAYSRVVAYGERMLLQALAPMLAR
ncbi:MAG: HPP family protein [Alphaproteobacteria bacterium]|nr:HPP family protein [Alphaproteobacteria bacterium]